MAILVGIYLLAAASVAGDSAAEPQQLTAEAASQLLLTDVRKEPHRITFTPELSRMYAPAYWGLYKVCVDREGKVATVKVIQAASMRHGGYSPPEADGLDRHWIATIKTWRYRAHQVNGQPTPFCYVANLEAPQQIWSAVTDLMSPEDGPVVRLSDINAFPYRSTLPPELNRAGFVIWGLYKVCVGTEGQVTKVSTIKSAHDAALDERWTTTMRTWRYQPHLENGKPRPYCFAERVEVRVVG